ncbi:MAG: hypothetical protein LBS74_11150 [Oscillospiraceae bacterium]|jgi:uncharacterized membrane protein YqjE|nr:hypothetical protein [Oscillospiraceae bacterium]
MSKTENVILFLLGELTIALIVLKLCKLAVVPWLWVFSPLWLPAAIILLWVAYLNISIFIQTQVWKCRKKNYYGRLRAQIETAKNEGETK